MSESGSVNNSHLICPSCKTGLRPGAKFCGSCGSRLQHVQSPIRDVNVASKKAKQVLSSWRQSLHDFTEAQNAERERWENERIIQEQRERAEQRRQKLVASIEAAEGFHTTVRQEIKSISANWAKVERQHFGSNFAVDSISICFDRCDAIAADALSKIQKLESNSEDQMEASDFVSQTEPVVDDLRKHLKEAVENFQAFDNELARVGDWFSGYGTSTDLINVRHLLLDDEQILAPADGRREVKEFRERFRSKLSKLQPYIVGYDVLAQAETAGESDDTNTSPSEWLNFFRSANSVSRSFLERLSSPDSQIGQRLVPVSLTIAYEASAKGLSLLESEPQTSLDNGESTNQIRQLHVETKQHLQEFFYVLQHEVGRDDAQDRELLREYGVATHALALERYDTVPDLETTSYDLHKHEAASENLALHRRLVSYNLFFRTVLDGVDKYATWWNQYEVTMFGHKGKSPIIDDLQNAKAQAKQGYEQSLEAILSQEWSLEMPKEDETFILHDLEDRQSEDTDNNVLLSLMRFNTGLSSLQGLDRYKEEFEKFLRRVSRNHPAVSTSVAMQFPDPDGPTELDSLQIRVRELEQSNARLLLERDRLSSELQSLRAAKQSETQQLRETMQRMEQMQVKEHERKRWERIMEGKATFGDYLDRRE